MKTRKEETARISKQRRELVIKSNDLIRNTRYNLTAVEQKIIIYLISKIVAQKTDTKTVQLSIKEYCDLTGIRKGGRGYQLVKDSIKTLRSKSWWIPKADGKEILFSWIDTAEIDSNNSGSINISLSDSLMPYLIELKGNFTRYELINVLTLHSKYSIRLYEIFKSFLWLGNWIVPIDEFRDLIDVQHKYKDYRDLKRYVIVPSVREISKYTDLTIKFSTRKKGKAVDLLQFEINEKMGYQISIDTILNQRERLNNE